MNILITGSTGSIGSAITNTLSKNKDNLVIGTTTDLSKTSNLSNDVKYIELNLSKIDLNDLEYKLANVLPDVLILNAGLTRDNLIMRMSEDQWSEVININLQSSFTLTKFFIKHMMKKRFGRIIFITSVVGHTGNPGQTNYVASKAGLTGFAKSLSLEVSSRNITVNCVAPGFIESNMTNSLTDDQKNSILRNIPLNRMGTSQEVANVVEFLASEKSSYITGQTIHVNGGLANI